MWNFKYASASWKYCDCNLFESFLVWLSCYSRYSTASWKFCNWNLFGSFLNDFIDTLIMLLHNKNIVIGNCLKVFPCDYHVIPNIYATENWKCYYWNLFESFAVNLSWYSKLLLQVENFIAICLKVFSYNYHHSPIMLLKVKLLLFNLFEALYCITWNVE